MDFDSEHMRLTEEELRRFQFLYYQHFHKVLTREEAMKEGLGFVEFIAIFLFAKNEERKCFWEYR